MKVTRCLLIASCVSLGLLQGCARIEVKPADEFGYRRNFNPPA